jgi:hypothetical protein
MIFMMALAIFPDEFDLVTMVEGMLAQLPVKLEL